jgi:hypothetical protein
VPINPTKLAGYRAADAQRAKLAADFAADLEPNVAEQDPSGETVHIRLNGKYYELPFKPFKAQ